MITRFKGIIGDDHLINDYPHDESEDFSFLPDVVLRPRTAREISKIMQLCNHLIIPKTPRGGGTGLSGGALPIHNRVVLSLERFNQILEIDELNLQATV